MRGCQWNHGIFDLDDKDGEWRDGQTDAARLLGMPRLTFNVAMQELEKLHLVHIDQVLLPLPIVNITVGDDGGLVEQPFAAPEQGNDRATTGREVGNVESDYPEKSMWSTPRLFSPGTPVSPIPYPSDTAPSPAATERTDQPSAEVGGGRTNIRTTRSN